ncbi:MAG TPA: NUDIX domain-containing protein [Candidatus Saccharimonadales bacterium]|nr:NUDIX domain-containing protein [Candidatus Saccharimonadales bacterium]
MELPMRKPRVTARVIVIDQGRLVLIKRRRYDFTRFKWREYYSIPGGGVEPGESLEQAAKREFKEELGVDIAVDAPIAVGRSANYEHHLFTGRLLGGQPEWQTDSEEMRFANQFNSYRLAWVAIEDLSQISLAYYAVFLPVILEVAAGRSPAEPVSYRLP